MVKLLGLLSAAWYAVSYVAALSSTGNSVLVILDPKLKREDYSTFFNGLKSRYIVVFGQSMVLMQLDITLNDLNL
jgi:hypothetical protein